MISLNKIVYYIILDEKFFYVRIFTNFSMKYKTYKNIYLGSKVALVNGYISISYIMHLTVQNVGAGCKTCALLVCMFIKCRMKVK